MGRYLLLQYLTVLCPTENPRVPESWIRENDRAWNRERWSEEGNKSVAKIFGRPENSETKTRTDGVWGHWPWQWKSSKLTWFLHLIMNCSFIARDSKGQRSFSLCMLAKSFLPTSVLLTWSWTIALELFISFLVEKLNSSNMKILLEMV